MNIIIEKGQQIILVIYFMIENYFHKIYFIRYHKHNSNYYSHLLIQIKYFLT